ncbi:TPA: integrase [Legionella pneumophila]|nr:integrase [Legionella pneumophila]HAT1860142.1 integrase [Legionella pneumophila]HEM1235621.1 integrase [Legionella pneumophila]
MRKYSLRQTANRYLQLDNNGSYRERKQRAYVIQKMIDDLFRIGDVPKSWNTLEQEHIQKLIEHWRKCHLKDATIMRHMTIIRNYLQSIDCLIPNIDNKSLQLNRQRLPGHRLNFKPNIWKSFSDDTSQVIMALQTQFGLTFSETFHIKPVIHIKEQKLWITRDIAFNSADRMVPIRNEVQKQILSDLNQLTNGLSLIHYLGYKQIRSNWHNTLANHNLPAKKSWRYLYAKQMYEYLLPLLGNYQTYLVLHEEMGIKSRNTLWSYLHE